MVICLFFFLSFFNRKEVDCFIFIVKVYKYKIDFGRDEGSREWGLFYVGKNKIVTLTTRVNAHDSSHGWWCNWKICDVIILCLQNSGSFSNNYRYQKNWLFFYQKIDCKLEFSMAGIFLVNCKNHNNFEEFRLE